MQRGPLEWRAQLWANCKSLILLLHMYRTSFGGSTIYIKSLTYSFIYLHTYLIRLLKLARQLIVQLKLISSALALSTVVQLCGASSMVSAEDGVDRVYHLIISTNTVLYLNGRDVQRSQTILVF